MGHKDGSEERLVDGLENLTADGADVSATPAWRATKGGGSSREIWIINIKVGQKHRKGRQARKTE
jgi:hypothetical protein